MKINTNINDLKTALLTTNIFIDNNYLDDYLNLMVNNQCAQAEPFRTQKHHIIPQCYFKYNNLDIDNSENNLVNLLYKDHILAHYYLCLCTQGVMFDKLVNAFFHLTNRKYKYNYDEFNVELLDNYQYLYEENKRVASDRRRGKPGPKWSAEARLRLSELTKGKPKNLSPEARINRSNRLKGNTHRKGIKESEETRLKKSKSMKGKKFPPEVGAKISKAKTGFKYSIESKNTMRDNWAQNHQGIFKPVICIETGIIYPSIKDASLSVGVDVNNCVVGREKTAAGYHWAYANDMEAQSKLKQFQGKPQITRGSGKEKTIMCVETNEIFESIKSAIVKYNCGSIQNCLKGRIKTAAGYHWKYLEEY